MAWTGLDDHLLLEFFFICFFLVTRLAANSTLLFHMKEIVMVIIYAEHFSISIFDKILVKCKSFQQKIAFQHSFVHSSIYLPGLGDCL